MLSPASVSNVVCGFDVLGFALNEPYDEMIVRWIKERTVRIVHHDNFGLPADPEKNIAGIAARAALNTAGVDRGVEIEITKNIKPGSGIGSSAASACGAVVAIDRGRCAPPRDGQRASAWSHRPLRYPAAIPDRTSQRSCRE